MSSTSAITSTCHHSLEINWGLKWLTNGLQLWEAQSYYQSSGSDFQNGLEQEGKWTCAHSTKVGNWLLHYFDNHSGLHTEFWFICFFWEFGHGFCDLWKPLVYQSCKKYFCYMNRHLHSLSAWLCMKGVDTWWGLKWHPHMRSQVPWHDHSLSLTQMTYCVLRDL